MFTYINNNTLTTADIIHAREEGKLKELLPSGTNIPFEFKSGERNSFDVGRDNMRTYLILHEPMQAPYYMNKMLSNAGGWPMSDMRKHVQQVYCSLPEEFRELAMPLKLRQRNADEEEMLCTDTAFLLSASQVFGDALPEWLRYSDCGEDQIDLFMNKRNIIKQFTGIWWLRSVARDHYFRGVYLDRNHSFNAYIDGGVVFAICIENRKRQG